MAGTYRNLVQSRLTDEQFKKSIIYCKNNNTSLSRLIRDMLGERIEGKEW